MSTPPFIRIRNVTRRFGDVVAVDDLSLDIGRGELFCLLGASGCGKTTLLRMLAGSRVLIRQHRDRWHRHVAGAAGSASGQHHVPELRAVPAYVGCRQYRLRAAPRRSPRAEVESRVEALLRLSGWSAWAGSRTSCPAGAPAGGAGHALARRPKLLLLDEPLAALDKKLREDTQFELVDIQETLGTTFSVVTHDQEEARTLARRIGVMEAGKLVQVDSPRVLYDQPKNSFVADFLGTVSFLDGRVESVEKGLLTIAGPVPVTAVDPGGFAVGESVRMAIRPEKISLARTATGAANEVEVTVEDMAFTGVASNYRVSGPGGVLLKLTQPNMRRGEPAMEWEETGFACFDPADVVLLRD